MHPRFFAAAQESDEEDVCRPGLLSWRDLLFLQEHPRPKLLLLYFRKRLIKEFFFFLGKNCSGIKIFLHPRRLSSQFAATVVFSIRHQILTCHVFIINLSGDDVVSKYLCKSLFYFIFCCKFVCYVRSRLLLQASSAICLDIANTSFAG